jgi:nitrate/TMAO reductase-like tetraheme cytochrome c subunit
MLNTVLKAVFFASALTAVGLGFAATETSPVRMQDVPVQGGARNPDSAESCGLCHTEYYKEWKETLHAKAWTDPTYQKALLEKKNPQYCYKCHIPESVLDRVGRQPKQRDEKDMVHEGISCVHCHKHQDSIHGPFGEKTDAHPTTKNVLFTPDGAIALCKGCHDTNIGPVIKLAETFEESGLRKQGKSCVGCHMPEVERALAVQIATGKPAGPVRKGRSHLLLGPSDPKFLATAFTWSVAKKDGGYQFTIGNAAGHIVPALTLRSFQFKMALLGADGKELKSGAMTFTTENYLNPTEQREVARLEAADATSAAVTLTHLMEGQVKAVIELGTKEL